MKCRWCAERYNGKCFNSMCPYRGDTCPMSEHPEVCKYAEEKPKPQLNTEELVTALRLCAGSECEGCPCVYIAESGGNCDDYIKRKAADMLEKLAAEKEAKKPEWISVKDRLLEKESVVRARIGKGQDQTEIISRGAYYNAGVTFEGYSLDAIPLSELPKEEKQ